MNDWVEVRTYTSQDAQPTLSVFLEAVTVTAASRYSPTQIAAWAGADERNLEEWHASRASRGTIVATVSNEVAGFSDIDIDGLIDMLFVSPRFARRGVATRLVAEVEDRARQVGATKLTVHASLLARPLLERLGFSVVAEEYPEIRGATLVNYSMVKEL